MTAKTVSPTRPRDVEATPNSLIGISKPVFLATIKSSVGVCQAKGKDRTAKQDSVKRCDQGPKVGCPVRVVKSASERKEPRQNLRYLSHQEKRPEGSQKHANDSVCKRDEVLDLGLSRGRHTERPQQINKISRLRIM